MNRWRVALPQRGKRSTAAALRSPHQLHGISDARLGACTLPRTDVLAAMTLNTMAVNTFAVNTIAVNTIAVTA
jgi:hypothetical protein